MAARMQASPALALLAAMLSLLLLAGGSGAAVPRRVAAGQQLAAASDPIPVTFKKGYPRITEGSVTPTGAKLAVSLTSAPARVQYQVLGRRQMWLINPTGGCP